MDGVPGCFVMPGLLPAATDGDDHRNASDNGERRHQRTKARLLAKQLAAGWPEAVSEVHGVILDLASICRDPRLWGRLS